MATRERANCVGVGVLLITSTVWLIETVKPIVVNDVRSL